MTDENENVQRQNLTDSPHYLARVLMENGIRNMYGVVGIPVTGFSQPIRGCGQRGRGRWIHYRQAIGGPDRIRPRFPQRIAGIA